MDIKNESGGSSEDLVAALLATYPELTAVREAAESPVYVVGGAVRDLLLGGGRADLDLVVEGDAEALARRLGADVVSHERFGTATVHLDGQRFDLAAARSETYARPGALPEVAPAPLEEDLARRDFTVNAMAVPLQDGAALVDPYDGRDDLDAKVLRVLHPASFVDDPTRALRAARYAARLDLRPDPATAELLRAADLGTVSADRRRAELLRLAAEPSAPTGFELLAEWGLVELRPDGAALSARVGELLATPPWGEVAPLDRAVLAAALGPAGGEVELAATDPTRPSQAVDIAHGRDGVELVLARALGAAWLDRYVAEWSRVELEIGGSDLIAAGIEPGPALGRGLDAALRAKLDGELIGREQELSTALAAARGG